MTVSDKEQILAFSEFLSKLGYKQVIGSFSIDYISEAINIILSFDPCNEMSDIYIKFKKENELYSIGWISSVRDNVSPNTGNKVEDILILLNYLRKSYNKLTNIQYCRESEKLIENFIARLNDK